METYFVEIVCQPREYKTIHFLRCLVKANDENEAREKAIKHYTPYYNRLEKNENSRFKVQCCWKQKSPTKRIIKEYANVLRGLTMPIPVRDNGGDTIGYREFKLHENDKSKKEIIDAFDRLDYTWSDVYYDTKLEGYAVTVNSYMCNDIVIRLFKGKTYEIYEEALKWVSDNTVKKDFFPKKFGLMK